MVKAASFNIGGHITLFFTIEKEGRLLRNQGSRGVGFNVTDGVQVSISEALEATFNNWGEAPTSIETNIKISMNI